ncbi:acyl carrier protein [Micromonospora inaquosa]|uniref:Actinorhodin polyketide synthase n=1 Tax=Micromonospora inaquosa TaxID=2203716 RepID=A0A3N9WBK4_9ACTN|nr:acyl carrier protein [Micromonospora inaquosa]RQW98099.1 actinorhodin polyketide synthase [Micromonospora inaquosa]
MAEQLTLTDLMQILREVAGADEGVDLNADVLDTSFQDLGYDSLALLEAGSRIEREYAVRLDDSTMTDATTPRALLDVINASLTPA